MREFFKGWRRKVGCVTLVKACMMTVMWVRSSCIFDSAMLSIGDLRLLFMSNNHKSGVILHKDRPIDIVIVEVTDGRKIVNFWRFDKSRFESQHFMFKPIVAGVGKVFCSDGSRLSEITLMPYWVVAIPLTLLSAYLLLSTPRKRTEADHA